MSIDDEAVEQPTVAQTAHQTVGQRLRAAREARGIDLVDVARDTRIPLRHLNALEADSHDGLPALTYTIGFVKSFAGALGLPPEEIAAQFRGETTKVVHVPQPSLIEPLDQRRAPPAWAVWAGGLGVAAIFGALIAYGLGAFDPPAPPDPVEVAAAEPLSVGEEVDQRVDPQPVEPQAAGSQAANADVAVAPAAPATSGAAAPPPVAAGADASWQPSAIAGIAKLVGGQPIETLTPAEARRQPTPTDAVNALLRKADAARAAASPSPAEAPAEGGEAATPPPKP